MREQNSMDTARDDDLNTDIVQNEDPKIVVNSLWKVFGQNNPSQVLEDSYRDKTREEIQQELGLVVALRNTSFKVYPGETFVVMGLSGSGKSTLVRCLIRLIEATSGEVIVDGEDITTFNTDEILQFRRSKMSMVFQNFGLLPHKNVLENVAYGLEIKGVGKERRKAVALEMLERVGLTGWEHSRQRELSGGMKQRVGIARALAVEPSILLMDEPFSGLDPLIRRQMRLELAELQRQIHKTIVFITHDLDEAVTVGDRIAIMRDGEIIQIGTPQEIVTRPVDDFVREFTLGVQKTKVIQAGTIARKPEIVVKDSDTLETLRSSMAVSDSAYAICVEENGLFKGLIRRETLDVIKRSEKKPLYKYFDQSVEVISSDTILEDLLPTLIESDHPVPVIDKENRCIGVATRRDVLRVIASEVYD